MYGAAPNPSAYRGFPDPAGRARPNGYAPVACDAESASQGQYDPIGYEAPAAAYNPTEYGFHGHQGHQSQAHGHWNSGHTNFGSPPEYDEPDVSHNQGQQGACNPEDSELELRPGSATTIDPRSWRPAMFKLWLAINLMQWFLLVVPIFVDDASGPGLAKCPRLPYRLLILFALCCVVCEIPALPPGDTTSRVMLALTFVNCLDLGTDSITAASVIAAHRGGNSKLESVWGEVLSQSLLPCHVPLWIVTVLVWCSGGFQMLMAMQAFDESPNADFSLGAGYLGFQAIAHNSKREICNEDDAKRQRSARFHQFLVNVVAKNLLQLQVQLTTGALSIALAGLREGEYGVLFSCFMGWLAMAGAFAGALPSMVGIVKDTTAPIYEKLIVYMVLIASVVLLLYAVAKFVGMFSCSQHLLNVTGCVELDS